VRAKRVAFVGVAIKKWWFGGADRIRTCDLLIANETLYQLSYDPKPAARQARERRNYGRWVRN
jgi:hypothetical protein